MLVLGQDKMVCEYVAAALGINERWTNCVGIGSDIDGVIRAGVVIERLTSFDAAMTVFSETPRAISADTLRGVFRVVFDDMGMKRVTFDIHPKNKRSRRLAEGLGARLEGKKRRGLDGRRNCLTYGLLPEECKFYENTQAA